MQKTAGPSALGRRLLLCRPAGGLNDALCQLEKCWTYADTYGRTLIVAPTDQTVVSDVLSRLVPRRPGPQVAFGMSEDTLSYLNSLVTNPSGIQGRLSSYCVERELIGKNYWKKEAKSGSLLTFDFGSDHPEELLVHDQFGGGNASHKAIRRLRLSSSASHTMTTYLPNLPSEYDSVHLRATDYFVDFTETLGRLTSKKNLRPLLVCSDSNEVLEYARGLDASREIITFPNHPVLRGAPLHRGTSFVSGAERGAAAERLLAELLALSGSVTFYYPPLVNHSGTARMKFSGFSRLVAFLVTHRFEAQQFFGQDALLLSSPKSGRAKPFASPLNRALSGFRRR